MEIITKTLKDYAKLRAKIAELEKQEAELSELVIADLKKQGYDTMQTPLGTFSITYRRKWSYSPKYQELTKSNREFEASARKVEEEEGVAKSEEVIGLSFRINDQNPI